MNILYLLLHFNDCYKHSSISVFSPKDAIYCHVTCSHFGFHQLRTSFPFKNFHWLRLSLMRLFLKSLFVGIRSVCYIY